MNSELDVNTFRWDLKLAALGDLDRHGGLVAGSRLRVLDLVDDIITLKNLAEDDVSAVEPPIRAFVSAINVIIIQSAILRGDDGRDEELGSVGVGTGVGHGQQTLLGVLELEVLVLELGTVD